VRNEWDSLQVTRRNILQIATGASLMAWRPLYGSSTEFWNKKPPEEWSSEEIDRLVTKSPWAKEVNAEFGSGGSGGSGGGRGIGGMGGPRIGIPGLGGLGGGGRGGGRRGGGSSGEGARLTGIVRWESAKPILQGLKTALPEAFASRYVISVSGLPLMGRGGRPQDESQEASSRSIDDAIDRLKGLTLLQPRDKAGAQPGIVQQQQSTGPASVLFGFSKEMLTLVQEDREVVFSTQFGRLAVKAKFNLKDMIYRGELAV
jgi:hypothetical protein